MGIEPLASGIDSLYWSCAPGIASERFAELRAARESAASGALEIEYVDGFALTVEPHGAAKYPVLLTAAEFSIQLTDSEQLPTAYVQLRSAFIHEVGPRGAYEASRAVVERLCRRPAGVAHVSRLDVYADFGGWMLSDADRRGVVSRSKISTVMRAGEDEYETIAVGKTPLMVRMYRKDLELRAHGGFAGLLWNGYVGPVVRIEAQGSGRKLSELGILTVDDALDSYGSLWSHATTRFCVLCVPGEGPRKDWPVSARWLAVWSLGAFRFPQSELMPVRKAAGDQERIARALLGYLKSWAAYEGVFTGEEAFARLRERYPRFVVGEGGSFAGDAVRRHARLARAVREGIA